MTVVYVAYLGCLLYVYSYDACICKYVCYVSVFLLLIIIIRVSYERAFPYLKTWTDNLKLTCETKLSLLKSLLLLLCFRLWLKQFGMNSTEVCASDDTDAERQHTTIYSTKKEHGVFGQTVAYVNVLLDLSEEDCSREQGRRCESNELDRTRTRDCRWQE